MYESYFGFTERPFDDTSNPRFFFANSANQAAFATLCYGVEAKKGLIVVTGETGTGKSTLLRKFLLDRRSNLCAAYIFSSFVSFTELLKHAMADLGLSAAGEGKAAMIAQLNDYLTQQFRSDNVVCFLVDEAQNLSDEILEEIRLLSNLEIDNKKVLQIVLAGQSELEQKLNQPNLRQLRQRIALRCRVCPLAAEEVGPYIDTRLETAGFRGRGLFSPEAVEQIALYASGIPRLVNHICDNALLNAFATSRSRISADIVQEVAQDLELPGRVERVDDASVSELRRAVGDDIFRPTRKKTLGVSPGVGSPRRDFDYTISSSEAWPVGFDLRKKKRSGRQRAVFSLVVLMIAGAAASLYSQRVTISGLRDNVEKLADGARTSWRSAKPVLPAPQKQPEIDSKAKVSSTEVTEVVPPSEEPVSADDAVNGEFLLPREEKMNSSDRSSKAVVEKRPKQGQEKAGEKRRAATDKERTEPYSHDDVSGARELKIKIYRAIHNRAINGVDVFVRGGTVYLGGEVATHRQRRAAVRATRSVPGVKEVRDQIAVTRTGRSNPRS